MPVTKTTRMTIEADTGEIKETHTQQFNVIPSSDEPEYVKLYVRAWCDFKGIDSLRPSDRTVLVRLFNVMTYAKARSVVDEHGNVHDEGWGQIIYTNAELKRSIARETGLQYATVNTAFTHLKKAGVLRRVGTGTYQVNPELVGKGKWSEIKKLRATFNVIGEDAGTVEVEAETGHDEETE